MSAGARGKLITKRVLCALVVGLPAASVWAQSPYVAGAIGAEIVRTTSVKSSGTTFDTGSGESWSGAIRVGTLVAPRVGVELEFLRAGAIDGDSSGPIYFAADLPTAGIQSRVANTATFPIVAQQTRVHTGTVSSLAFVQQDVGERVSLIYLGGIGFSRVVHETEFGIPRPLVAESRPIVSSNRTRTIQYGVGPIVGVEARVGMTDHARLVTGVRLHAPGQSLVDGWIVRPNVGLAWVF